MVNFNKLKALRKRIKNYENTIIAFSGGVDSTFLLMEAVQELGERVLAVTWDTVLIPRQELQDARKIAQLLGANHMIITAEPLQLPGVRDNSPERCYYCKQHLLGCFVNLPRKRAIRSFWMAPIRMMNVTTDPE